MRRWIGYSQHGRLNDYFADARLDELLGAHGPGFASRGMKKREAAGI